MVLQYFFKLKKVKNNSHLTCFKQDAFILTINQILTFIMAKKKPRITLVFEGKNIGKVCTKNSIMSVEQLYKRITRIFTMYVLFLPCILLLRCMLHIFKTDGTSFFNGFSFYKNELNSVLFLFPATISLYFFLLGPWKESMESQSNSSHSVSDCAFNTHTYLTKWKYKRDRLRLFFNRKSRFSETPLHAFYVIVQ